MIWSYPIKCPICSENTIFDTLRNDDIITCKMYMNHFLITYQELESGQIEIDHVWLTFGTHQLDELCFQLVVKRHKNRIDMFRGYENDVQCKKRNFRSLYDFHKTCKEEMENDIFK